VMVFLLLFKVGCEENNDSFSSGFTFTSRFFLAANCAIVLNYFFSLNYCYENMFM